MRLLFLSLGVPLPVNNGHKMRTWSILCGLAAEGHEIDFLTFAQPEEAGREYRELSRICRDVQMVPLTLHNLTSSSDYWGRLRGLFSSRPYATRRFSSERMRQCIEASLDRGNLDAIVCDTVYSACNLPQTSLPLILNNVDVEHVILERYLPFESNPVKRIYARLESRKVKNWEQKICQKSTIGMACSEHDRRALQVLAPQLPMFVVPNVIDTETYTPGDSDAEDPNGIVYQGGMDWFPNRDAVEYFVSQIFPMIRREIPEVRFIVAGRNPSEEFRKQFIKTPGIEFTGTVPDMRPVIAKAAVCVVPLRIGSGTRLKILEAGAMGKGMVSTPLGAEGLDFRDGQEICIADNPAEFAEAVVALMKNPSRRSELGRAARRKVMGQYSMDALQQALRIALNSSSLKIVEPEGAVITP